MPPLRLGELPQTAVAAAQAAAPPEASEDGGAQCLCAPAEELNDPNQTEIPPKIINAAERFYAGLSGRHQLIVKLISPLESFSIHMVTNMLAEHVKMGGGELTNKGLLLEMKDLVTNGVFLEVPPTPYILEHDLAPTEGYVFVSKLMQRQVQKIMLNKEWNNIMGRMAELKKSVVDYRQKELEEKKLAEKNAKMGQSSGTSTAGGRNFCTRTAPITAATAEQRRAPTSNGGGKDFTHPCHDHVHFLAREPRSDVQKRVPEVVA